MIPYWNSTLTVFNRSIEPDGKTIWATKIYKGCFWHHNAARERTGGAEFKQRSFICRIPGNNVSVNVGDVIVCGEAHDDINEYVDGKRSTDLVSRYAGKCMVVSAVHYNSGHVAALNHLYAEGS